jgi:hypothetical protein
VARGQFGNKPPGPKYNGNITVSVTSPNGSERTVDTLTGALRRPLDTAWDKAGKHIDRAVKTQLHQVIDRINGTGPWKGGLGIAHDTVTLHDSAWASLSVELKGRNIELRYYIPGSVAEFNVTTGPGIDTLPQKYDPHMVVSFDCELRVTIPVPEAGAPLQASNATINLFTTSTRNESPDGGDILKSIVVAITGDMKANQFNLSASGSTTGAFEWRDEVNRSLKEETTGITQAAGSGTTHMEPKLDPDLAGVGIRLSLIPPPTAPANVSVSNKSGDLFISWTADKITHHVEIERKVAATGTRIAIGGVHEQWGPVGQAPASKGMYVDKAESHRDAAKPYTYRVWACNAAGRTCSEPAVAKAGTSEAIAPESVPGSSPGSNSIARAPTSTPIPIPQKRKIDSRRLPSSADSSTPAASPAATRSMIPQRNKPTTNGDTQALNPQPIPPGIPIMLKGGLKAEVSGNSLLITNPNGTRAPAKPGRYFTTDGRTIVVDAQGKIQR